MRATVQRLLRWAVPPAAVAALLLGYARFVEPVWIEVTRHALEAPLASPVTVALLADLHTRGSAAVEGRLLRILDEVRPDAILVAGDTISIDSTYQEVGDLYRKLHAPHGVWVVRGNWENAMSWREFGVAKMKSPPPSEAAFYEAAGVRWLQNEAAEIVPGLWVVGVDDFSFGVPDYEKARAKVPRDAFSITLFHSPEYFDHLAGRTDLVLTGHTHGGQVRIPFLPPFYSPAGSGRYLEGWYEREGTRMYVSRGIGTSILPLRFRARPEIAVFTLGFTRRGTVY